MKSTCVLVVWLSLYLPEVAAAQEVFAAAQEASAAAQDEGLAAAQEIGAVRAMDPAATEAFECGLRGSPAFRDLVAEVDSSGVIVHVVTGDTVLFGTAGTTRLAAVVGGWRYLRVTLRSHLAMEERASVLAHELHHVLEISRSSAATQHAVRALYDEIGRPVLGMHDAFETADASYAGMRVWRELRSAGRQAGRWPASTHRQR